MQGKVIKKTVPNEPIVRKKPKEEPINNEIIINSGEDSIRQSNNEEPKLKGARNRIKRNQPFTMNAFDGSSKSEKTETKPDGTIVRTIIEINGNQKKTTVITTKGGCTKTNTRIETVSGGSSSNNKGNDGFGFGRMDSDFDSGFGNFDKMWEKQVNQMNNFYNNFANFGNQKGYHYEYSSSSKGNKNDNKNNKKEIEWEYDFGDNNNKKNTGNKNDDWDYGWGTDNKNEKKTEKTKKYDDWDYGWGTDSNTNKKNNTDDNYSQPISGTDFQKSALDAHNNYRAKHHVGKLVLNQELCDIAQKYAEELARTGNFAHSGNSFHDDNMGENLFACYGMKITGKMMTDDWYNEVNQYNFNNPGYISGTGHFTQIVWKGSKQVGFGYAQARDGYYYGVANYYPAGNFIGEFEDNVFRA
jgi:uncharacterized protein YkwD